MTPEQQAARILVDGGLIAHATEGVWGFACDPLCEQATFRLLEIKGRSWEKGLLLLGGDASDFKDQLAELPQCRIDRVTKSWPGHNTWVLPDTRYPRWVRGIHTGVACRVPDHDQARRLARLCGFPFISTSLNRAGRPPITRQADAQVQFAGVVDFIMPGETSGYSGPSVIRDSQGEILRGTS